LQYLIPLTTLTGQDVADDLRAEIALFEYAGNTDIGLALVTAADMLQLDGLQNPVVILITDGWIEISPLMTRTAADSRADVDIAMALLDGRIPVFPIGMNHPWGGVDEGLLATIAAQSGTFVSITNDAAELAAAFNAIYTAHRVEVPEEVIIEIPIEEPPDPREEEPALPYPEEPYIPEPQITDEINQIPYPPAEIQDDITQPPYPTPNYNEETTPGALMYGAAVFAALSAAAGVIWLFKTIRGLNT